ncbi:2186_t:CDS:1 [Cetraspora pellucida]|uniref:2186_t:CDS:1 n=1 Tax=Cetraspora pellucida TaxID=1433469 RepID=A0ACA9LQH8_9GLOM|nr:2186_t:CDS:1 [Cetraspora pellucida]
MKKRIYYPVIIFIYGPSGSGKTSFVKELFGNVLYDKPIKAKSGLDYWTGYKEQSIILIDEFDIKINWLSLTALLNDDNSNIEIEPDKFVLFNAKYIFITNTNLLEEDTYSNQFLYSHLTYIIEFQGKWDDDIEKRTTEIIFHKGDERKFCNMEWNIEYRKENINNINTVEIQNEKIDGKNIYNHDGKIYFKQEFLEYMKKYLLDFPKSKPLFEYRNREEKKFSKSIIPKFKEYSDSQKYLFLKKDDEILNLDDFSYTKDDKNTPQIITIYLKKNI